VTRRRIGAAAAGTIARVLLCLYPASVRTDVGDAMVADVRRRATDLRGIRLAPWLIRLAGSLVYNAGAEWSASRRRSRHARAAVFSWLDLKLALRMLVKYPGLTLTGGLGIAVAVAIGVTFFAILHSRFYPTIPLHEGDRLVGLENWDRRTGREERRSLHDFGVWRQGLTSVQDMAAFRTVTRNVIGQDGSVEPVELAEMTPSGFLLARVPPLLGRSLVPADAAPGAPPVIVIGFDVWQSRFGSAPDVIGTRVRLGRTRHTIVGVMPKGFAFPVNHRYWIPLDADSPEYPRAEGPEIYMAGRLAPGRDLAAAHAELTVLADRMAARFPDTHGHLRAEVLPYGYLTTGMSRSSGDGFWPMCVMASLMLVIVCVNVAILIYARTATRLGEIAVRSALGASRARIVAQLSTESLVLSASAAATGLFTVKVLLDQLTRMALPLDGLGAPPFWLDYGISRITLGHRPRGDAANRRDVGRGGAPGQRRPASRRHGPRHGCCRALRRTRSGTPRAADRTR